MPGSADIPGLNVQFGALDFGSEAGGGAVDMGQKESSREHGALTQGQAPAASVPMTVPTAVPMQQQQQQSSLFSQPGSMRFVRVVLKWCKAQVTKRTMF